MTRQLAEPSVKSISDFCDRIAVRQKNILCLWKFLEQIRAGIDCNWKHAILSFFQRDDLPSIYVVDELHSPANTENRNVQVENFRVQFWRISGCDAAWTA